MKPFRFDDPRQARVFERLNRLVGAGPAAFYQDACRLMSEEATYESTTHLVAHLLREIESALRDVLEPVAGRSSGHKPEIRAVLKALEIPEDDPLAFTWLGLAGTEADSALHRRAHRDALGRPRPINGNFRDWWTQIESVLDVVLSKLESKFSSYQQTLDRLVSKAAPAEADVETLKNHVPNSLIVSSYFFDRLGSAGWLEPLASEGFFKYPPEPIRDETGVAIPRWPASGFLKRMASESPEVVMNIIDQVRDTGNTRVHEDFADAALAERTPAALAARWARKESDWVSLQDSLFFGLPRKLGQVVSRLAREGEGGAALELARALLAVLPGPRSKPDSSGEELWHLPPEPRSRFDIWEYEQILKHDMPGLMAAVGRQGLVLLWDLLQDAIEVSQPEGTPQPHDLSYIWRPAIEDHGQNLNLGVKPLLVTAVRESAEALAQRDPSEVGELLNELEQRGQSWLIFRRVALHLLRILPASPPEIIARCMTDRTLFDEVGVRHEYLLLMKERFKELGENKQQIILGWIGEGPDATGLKARLEEFVGRSVTDGEVEKYRESWRRERLEPIADWLERDWRNRYEALTKETPVPRHPEFPVYTSGGAFGASSPKTLDELKEMSPRALADYLKAWQPSASDPFHGATPEGLGRQVAGLVSADPQKYAAEIYIFALEEPTYVRAVLWGFHDAQKQGRTFDWDRVLDLCAWASEHSREIPDRKASPFDILDRDANWAGARDAVLRLLSEGLEKETGVMPFSLRNKVWRALEPITKDPHPTREEEDKSLFCDSKQKYGATGLKIRNMDILTYSVNTVRGEAMHTVVRYALWVRRNLERQPDASELLAKGFDTMPEVRRVVDERLDVKEEPSLAVRAVYGHAFLWLYQIDPAWTKTAASRIFPSDFELDHYWDAAWEAYICSWPAYDEIAVALHEQYKAAVEHIGRWSEKVECVVNVDERLAGHLMTLHWRGKLEYDSDLLAGFYTKARAKLRAHAMNFIGFSLYQDKDQIPSEILDRLKSFWRRRLETAQACSTEDVIEELAQFGWWFVCKKFDDDWAVEQLADALQISKSSASGHLVVGRLAELCGKMPRQAVKCLSLLIEGDTQGWGILGWQDDAKKIIKGALQSGDTEADRSARDLVNRLGSLGHFGFMELLGSPGE